MKPIIPVAIPTPLTIDITDMSIEHKASHMLEVLNFTERNCDDEFIQAALIDAMYVIEQQRLEIASLQIQLAGKEEKHE